MFKVALINIWFSNKFPSYFDFFCKSCEINSVNFNWYIFTNIVNKFVKVNEAVYLVPYSWEKLIFEFKLKEDIDHLRSESAWQTVCAWPKNGFPYRMLLFKKKDFWANYDFIGTSDLDVVFGKLDDFIKEEIYDYGMITAHSGRKTPQNKSRNCCPFSFYNKKDIDIIWDYKESETEARDDNYDFSDFFSRHAKIYSPKNLQPIGDSLFMGKDILNYKCVWNDRRVFVQNIEGGMFHLLPFKEFKKFKICKNSLNKNHWLIDKYGINSKMLY